MPQASPSVPRRSPPLELELAALLAVERAARLYARHSHGNIGDKAAYREREEAREQLRDALAWLDRVRGNAA